jgi:hypothetical protein
MMAMKKPNTPLYGIGYWVSARREGFISTSSLILFPLSGSGLSFNSLLIAVEKNFGLLTKSRFTKTPMVREGLCVFSNDYVPRRNQTVLSAFLLPSTAG